MIKNLKMKINQLEQCARVKQLGENFKVEDTYVKILLEDIEERHGACS